MSRQSFVAIDVGANDADRIGSEVLDDLIDRGVVLPDVSTDFHGYPPGEHATAAVLEPEELNESSRMSISTTRSVFDTGENAIELSCATCGHLFAPAGRSYIDCIDRWWQGEADIQFTCPCCGASRALCEWDGPSAFGIGCLGFEFCDWPLLNPWVGFLIAERVGRVRFVLARA